MARWRGGAGDDLYQASEASVVRGARGHDTLTGSKGADLIFGGKGDDVLEGARGDDRLYGGAGDDLLNDGSGDNTLRGGDGDDLIVDGHTIYDRGFNLIDGGDGYDVVRCDGRYATLGLQSIQGVERIEGGLSESSGGSRTYTRIQGGDGADSWDFSAVELIDIGYIDGGAGDDRIVGSSGDDSLIGAKGDDTLIGGGGHDRLLASQGSDLLTGGRGRDIFHLGDPDRSAPADHDLITDFVAGRDKLEATWIRANAASPYVEFAFVGATAFTGVAGELRYEVCGCGDTVVEADLDADGVGDIAIWLRGAHTLTAGDFIL